MTARAEISARLPMLLAVSEAEAAALIGVSAGTFRKLVEDGTMPRPRLIGARRLWAVDEVAAAFKALPREGSEQSGPNTENPWD